MAKLYPKEDPVAVFTGTFAGVYLFSLCANFYVPIL